MCGYRLGSTYSLDISSVDESLTRPHAKITKVRNIITSARRLAEPHPRAKRLASSLTICIYPAAGILQSNQIAELLVTRLLRHYHYVITFPRERGLGSQCIIKRHLFLRHCIPLAVKLDARPSRIALVRVAPIRAGIGNDSAWSPGAGIYGKRKNDDPGAGTLDTARGQ